MSARTWDPSETQKTQKGSDNEPLNDFLFFFHFAALEAFTIFVVSAVNNKKNFELFFCCFLLP